jgi:hypothetical protein
MRKGSDCDYDHNYVKVLLTKWKLYGPIFHEAVVHQLILFSHIDHNNNVALAFLSICYYFFFLQKSTSDHLISDI